MAGELVPEEYSKRTETIGDYPVTITFYRLGSTYNGTVKLSSLAAFSPPAATAKSLILSL